MSCIFASASEQARANAATLIGCYLIAYHGASPDQILAMFDEHNIGPFVPFRDAGAAISTYNLSVRDVLMGFHRGMGLGWIDLRNFNPEEYEHYEQPENGDWNWIVPGKFLAFAGPTSALPPCATLRPC